MRSLFLKELRALVPLIGLVLGLALTDDLFALVAEFPDKKPLSSYFEANESVGDLTLGMVIVSLILATGLLVRENDEGTLNFLDGLPVTRLRIFAAKWLAALAVITSVVVVEVSGAAIFHALSRNSLEATFPWQILGAGFAVNWVAGFAWLGIGLALSFLRRWLFLLLGLLGWAFFYLSQHRVPYLDLFDPFDLGRPTYHQERWLIPHAHLIAHLGLGVVGAGLALVAFHFTGDRTRHLADWLRQTRFTWIFSGLAIVLIPGVWIALAFRIGTTIDTTSADHQVAPADPTERHNTAHYAFIYRQSQEPQALALIAEADAVHDLVADFLGAPHLPDFITVDSTSSLQSHNAGQAYWKKIRMTLPDAESGDELAAVLCHETTHVYLDQLSDMRMADVFSSTRFFHEGLASYLEYRLFRSPEELVKFRRVAAVAHAWGHTAFDQFTDDAELSRKVNRDLVYPIGELFCSALVGLYGDDAPGRIARAFVRKEAPKSLKELALWQDTLQACGYDLEAVLAALRIRLDELAVAERAFIDTLPRLRATIELASDHIIIRPAFNGPAPGKLLCITRATPDAAVYELDHATPDENGSIRISRQLYPGRVFWYQLGWRVDGAAMPLMEAWIEAPAGP